MQTPVQFSCSPLRETQMLPPGACQSVPEPPFSAFRTPSETCRFAQSNLPNNVDLGRLATLGPFEGQNAGVEGVAGTPPLGPLIFSISNPLRNMSFCTVKSLK